MARRKDERTDDRTDDAPAPRRWRRPLLAVLTLGVGSLLVLVASTGWLAALGTAPGGDRLARMGRSPHHKGDVFVNPVATEMMPPGGLWTTLRRQFGGDEQRTPHRPLPTVPHRRADYPQPAAPGLRATWLGHATTLLELDGRRVLLDPMWSDRGSPSTLVGPRRFFDPPLPFAELPAIDVVVISHDHYDHLDMATIKDLNLRGVPFVVPLGVGAHLEGWGVSPGRITELDWGEHAVVAGVDLIAAPARHFSGRSLLDRNRTLWASWILIGPSHRVYFSGDSGYFDGFREIGAAHGPFDLTLIKIGAYGETWPDIHVNPEQAVQAHKDVRGRVLLPVHWGTFNLAFHSWYEPAERVTAAARARGVTVVVPRPGELVDVAAPPSSFPWWRGE